MLTFFRANSPFQILFILIVLLLLKLPFILGGLPILGTELEWMLIGERLNFDRSLYQDIWTSVAPLSAYFYGFVHFVFGRSPFNYEIVALVIVFIQALLFTRVVNKNQVLLERNYIPGLLYVVVMSLSFDANKLSPALLATTFLILALNSFFRHINGHNQDSEPIFGIGLFIGIGSLFLSSFSVFIIWSLLCLLMFTSVKFKDVLLLFLGFLVPLFMASLFFYFIGNFEVFYYQWLIDFFRVTLIDGSSFLQILLTYSLPIFLAVLGIFKVLARSRYSSYQNRKHQILILSGMFGVVCFFLSGDTATYQLLVLAPFLAFFMAGWFIHFKGTALTEITFFASVLLFLLINAQGVKDFFGGFYKHLDEKRVVQTTDKSYITDRPILITGTNNHEYYFAKSGSAYLNWDVSKFDLESPNVYESLLSIHANFEKELPEYILDNEQVFPEIFRRMPEIGAKYSRIEGTRHFRLK